MTPAQIVNVSRNVIIAADARCAETPRERRRGLIGRQSMERGEALVIARCRQVHTFGMRFNIDVAFVGRDSIVVRACYGLRPRRFSPVTWRACDAIEFPAGTLSLTGTKPGDSLRITTVEA